MTQPVVVQPQASGSARVTGLVFAAGFVTGALTVALVAGVFSTGDEAPIRVRGGSMYLDIQDLTMQTAWDPEPNEWGLTRGIRSKEGLDVVVVPDFLDSCSKVEASANKLFVEYDDGFTVEIHGTGKHLKVKDQTGKLKKSSDQVLKYGDDGKGFIKKLYVDNQNGTPLCTFTESKRLRWLEVDDK